MYDGVAGRVEDRLITLGPRLSRMSRLLSGTIGDDNRGEKDEDSQDPWCGK